MQNLKESVLAILQNLLEEIQVNKNKNSLGNHKKVLVENKLKNQNKFFGRTFDLTPVVFDAREEDIGKIIQVEITNYNRNSLFGFKKILNKEVAA